MPGARHPVAEVHHLRVARRRHQVGLPGGRKAAVFREGGLGSELTRNTSPAGPMHMRRENPEMRSSPDTPRWNRFRHLSRISTVGGHIIQSFPYVPRWETVKERGDGTRQHDLGLLFVLGPLLGLFSAAAAAAIFLVREGRVVRVAGQGLLQLKIRRAECPRCVILP